jgi:hypothetical protein
MNLWVVSLPGRFYFEGMCCWGLLLGFTVLTAPSPGIAVNLGPLTLLLWRADMAKN